MQRRPAHAARGFWLAVGPVIGVQQAQALRHALAQVNAVPLEGLGAANIHVPEVKGRLAIYNPLRQRIACAA